MTRGVSKVTHLVTSNGSSGRRVAHLSVSTLSHEWLDAIDDLGDEGR